MVLLRRVMCVGRMADMGRDMAEVRSAIIIYEAHEQNKKNHFFHATHVRGKLPLNLSSMRCECENE